MRPEGAFETALSPLKRVARLLSHYRRSLLVLAGVLALGVLLVQTVPFASMAWSALSGGPDIGLVQDVRHALLEQPPFREMIAEHEKKALRRHRRGGGPSYQRRRLVRVNLTPFGLPGFHDVFAVRVRSDIVEGEAYTSFLARPGAVIDPNAATFFSGQCEGAMCRDFIRSLVGAGHQLLEWGVLSPFRLNITEMDATSSVSTGTEPISTSEWAEQSLALHREGKGRSFPVCQGLRDSTFTGYSIWAKLTSRGYEADAASRARSTSSARRQRRGTRSEKRE